MMVNIHGLPANVAFCSAAEFRMPANIFRRSVFPNKQFSFFPVTADSFLRGWSFRPVKLCGHVTEMKTDLIRGNVTFGNENRLKRLAWMGFDGLFSSEIDDVHRTWGLNFSTVPEPSAGLRFVYYTWYVGGNAFSFRSHSDRIFMPADNPVRTFVKFTTHGDTNHYRTL